MMGNTGWSPPAAKREGRRSSGSRGGASRTSKPSNRANVIDLSALVEATNGQVVVQREEIVTPRGRGNVAAKRGRGAPRASATFWEPAWIEIVSERLVGGEVHLCAADRRSGDAARTFKRVLEQLLPQADARLIVSASKQPEPASGRRRLAIIFITPETADDLWLVHRAGTLFGSRDDGRCLFTLLIGIERLDRRHPLARWAVRADRAGFRRLIVDLAGRLGDVRTARELHRLADAAWPRLARVFSPPVLRIRALG
jgi:hypothetical protein